MSVVENRELMIVQFIVQVPGIYYITRDTMSPQDTLLTLIKVYTGWANKKQANFKLPPFQKFFIFFSLNFQRFPNINLQYLG